jgi:hypothetical protein
VPRFPPTKIFISGDPLGVHEKESFSFALRGLIRRFQLSALGSPAKRESITTLDRLCHPGRKKTRPAHLGLANFRAVVQGYLDLVVEARLDTDKQAPLSPRDTADDDIGREELRNERSTSIMSGYCIHPQAGSILKDNALDGLMMETTWAVMLRYVNAIRVAIKLNTVIPIAFSFGPTESHELYQEFCCTFQEKCDVDLSQYPILCDQGSALAKGCKDNGNRRFLCLHHFLRTLNDPTFGIYAKNLVRCRTLEEFDKMRELL